MGVPRLFKYICERHPSHIRRFVKGSYTTNVEYMYIDSNAIIHNIAQRVWNYGTHARVLYAYKNLTKEEKILKTYELYFETIVELTKIITPTKVLYIAIDGVAPVGKICQQRERRFQSSIKNRGTDFNSNVISPGTTFEFELTNYMYYAIRKEMSVNNTWKNIQVIFSPPTIPGEGEHKILEYIRNLENKDDYSHCMYGPDGDLIMLSLAIKCPNFILFKEDAFDVNGIMYYVLDIGGIGRDLSKDMNNSLTSINDFVLIGFFVGNDFIPKIQMFHMLENGLDTMLSIYNSLGIPLSDNNGIIMESFQKFIYEVSLLEKRELEKQSKVRVQDERFINKTLLKSMGYNGLDLQSYAKDYYSKAHVDDIGLMCKSYIKSMAWVFLYYTQKCPSYLDYYPYHYSPLMDDLAKKEYFSTQITFEMSKPLTPFQQLLCVLPSTDKMLLPSPYYKLMMKSSPIYDFYPSTFDIDYEGKLQEYQGIALLPFIDVSKVIKHYYTIKTKYKYKRNTLGHVCMFMYDGNKRKYTSKYGTINECSICMIHI